jgi:hypothetical protein
MIADGNYAIYGIGEKGAKEKMGSFKVKDGAVSGSNSSSIPNGEIDEITESRIQRLLQDNHGYTHIEKV